MKKKNLIKVLLFLCLLVLVIAGLYRILSWKDTSGDYISMTEQLKNTGKNKIDVVFAGSSHVYRGVYPAVLWEDAGIAAFDLSNSEQDKETTYYGLKELLRKQSPQVVFVEMYGLMFDEHEKVGDKYRNLLAFCPSVTAYEIAREGAEADELVDYLTRFPIIHTRYKELKKYDFLKNPVNAYYRGEVVENGEESGSISAEVTACRETTEVSDSNRLFIDRLITLSKEENFTLVFFMTPYEESLEERRIENGAREYIEEQGFDYIDLKEHLTEMDFVPEEDLGDVWHCSLSGAKKVTEYLEGYLLEHYTLTNHQGDSAFSQWEKDAQHYHQILQEHAIKTETDAEKRAELIAGGENLTVLLSLEGDYEEELPLLEEFGIAASDVTDGGKWLIRDGEITKIMDNIPGESHVIELNDYDTFKVQYTEDGNYLIHVLFDNEGVNSLYNGLNILVYDEFEQSFLGNFGTGD